MARVALIGDVGGHVEQLVACLRRLGITDSSWPSDLTVVHVGDLVGGRRDLDCVHVVDPHLRAGRWIQLIGNWELAAVGGPPIQSRDGRAADREALRVIAGWHAERHLLYATTVTAPSGRAAIVTHAGITAEWYAANIDASDSVENLAAQVNAVPARALHEGGLMMGCESLPATPVWAAIEELYPSWLGPNALPWPQVHGHTSGKWLARSRPDLTAYARYDAKLGHIRFTPPGSTHSIVGIDPGLWDRSPVGSLHALVVGT